MKKLSANDKVRIVLSVIVLGIMLKQCVLNLNFY